MAGGGEHGGFFRVRPAGYEIVHVESILGGKSRWLFPAVAGIDLTWKDMTSDAMRAALVTYGAFGLDQVSSLALDDYPWFFEELKKLTERPVEGNDG